MVWWPLLCNLWLARGFPLFIPGPLGYSTDASGRVSYIDNQHFAAYGQPGWWSCFLYDGACTTTECGLAQILVGNASVQIPTYRATMRVGTRPWEIDRWTKRRCIGLQAILNTVYPRVVVRGAFVVDRCFGPLFDHQGLIPGDSRWRRCWWWCWWWPV